LLAITLKKSIHPQNLGVIVRPDAELMFIHQLDHTSIALEVLLPAQMVVILILEIE
jgi:hypothetical protein